MNLLHATMCRIRRRCAKAAGGEFARSRRTSDDIKHDSPQVSGIIGKLDRCFWSVAPKIDIHGRCSLQTGRRCGLHIVADECKREQSETDDSHNSVPEWNCSYVLLANVAILRGSKHTVCGKKRSNGERLDVSPPCITWCDTTGKRPSARCLTFAPA